MSSRVRSSTRAAPCLCSERSSAPSGSGIFGFECAATKADALSNNSLSFASASFTAGSVKWTAMSEKGGAKEVGGREVPRGSNGGAEGSGRSNGLLDVEDTGALMISDG